MAAMMGSAIGTVVTWPLIAIIIESIGWKYGFYIPAILVILFAGFWYFLVFNSPADHPRINSNEREYIASFHTDLSTKPVILKFFFQNI